MRCTTYVGRDRCNADATHRMYAPDGSPVPGGYGCDRHTFEPIREYAEKLGEVWTAIPIDEYGRADAR